MTLSVLVGNPRPGSRTATAALAAARHVADRRGLSGDARVIELSDLAPTLLAPTPDTEVTAALERVRSSRVLVVASPTYKATYTGLLKAFLDLLPGDALSGVTALPLLVMGSPAHTLAVEVHLRPLLLELGATVPTPGLAVLQSTIESTASPGDGSPLDEQLTAWATRVAPQIPPSRDHEDPAGDRG
ncbi:NAD(P)H-dependent oxidoreductase [Spiractinospora alimapuensis]|uniref:NAD(P)H-dependent oxidoreductase n=1 Tax=Spiractinospora alimapuensis TaxID=2820884 RepID=UPI001F20E742|nr:NAD(P)H-dependent oxidoreductase [Spiractinospora alimapuensis]QVQ51804.1 NAD(P)H-dependent oxidoreductase [Spiractinospora alimapuensis]